jgi:hypothetical protein
VLFSLYAFNVVMAGHSRPKDGVASFAYVPAIHVVTAVAKTRMPATSAGMTAERSTR